MSMYRRAHAGFDYELWLRRGHKGTPDDFLEWLRGSLFNGFSPKDFGAEGNGVHDDSEAIKSAIEAAGEGGKVVLDANTTYLVTQTLELKDGQTFDGNGATILWKGVPTYNESGKISNAPYIFFARGSLGDEIKLAEAVRVVGNASSSDYGSDNANGFTFVVISAEGLDSAPYQPGDRIIVQAARNALAPESGEYWTGTSTGLATSGAWWAEPLVVNEVRTRKSLGVVTHYVIKCVGTAAYPYYLPEAEAGVDVSKQTIYAYIKNTDHKYVRRGYYVYEDPEHPEKSAKPLYRAFSTVRKANFLQNVRLCNLNIRAEGVTHSGDPADNSGQTAAFAQMGNTIRFELCENAMMENVSMVLTDAGRGFYLYNCLNSQYKDCTYESRYTVYGVWEGHTYTNAFTFASTWYCTADGCTTIKAGQSFDTSYAGSQAHNPFDGGDWTQIQNSYQQIRCPAIFTTVRDCTVIGSLDSAATNHSGGYGQLFEGCRFINCARPVAIRSPLTTIKNCTFSGQAGKLGKTDDPDGTHYRAGQDVWHLTFAEPTCRGAIVEGCTFSGGRAVNIAPQLDRYFDFAKGNYVEMATGAYVESFAELPQSDWVLYNIPAGADPETYMKNTVKYPHIRATDAYDSTNTYLTPPDQKSLGIQIRGNTFHSCQQVLMASSYAFWLKDHSLNLTDYAKGDMGVYLCGNTIIDCGRHYYPVYITGDFVNGIRIDDNRFVRCVSSKTDGYWSSTTTGGVTEWKSKTPQYLIYFAGQQVRMAVNNNTVEECGGFRYLYTKKATVDEALGTNGNPVMMCTGNKILSWVGSRMSVTSDANDSETDFSNPGKSTAERIVASPDKGFGMGQQYDFDDKTIAFEFDGNPRIFVEENSLRPETRATPTCILRTWCEMRPLKQNSIKWRVALYNNPETVTYTPVGGAGQTQTLVLTRELYERIALCWQRGKSEDEEETAATFSSDVILAAYEPESDSGNEPEEPAEPTVIGYYTIPAPLNYRMDYVQTGNWVGKPELEYATKDGDTGIVSVTPDEAPDVTGTGSWPTVLAFEKLNGFSPADGDEFVLFCEVRDNSSSATGAPTGHGIRADSSSTTNNPSLFVSKSATSSGNTDAVGDDEVGIVTDWSLKYTAPEPAPTLGRSSAPWQKLYVDEIHKIVVPSSTPASAKKFRITVDDSGTITATEVT